MPRGDGFFGEEGLGLMARVGNVPFVVVIVVYRLTLSAFVGGQCRFEPTCSLYGLDAYRRYGPVRGTRLTLGRVCRCHPFHRGGYDPVPFPEVRGVHGEGEEGNTADPGAVECTPDGGVGNAERSGDLE